MEDKSECAEIPELGVVRGLLALHSLLDDLHEATLCEGLFQLVDLVRSEDLNKFVDEPGHEQLYLFLELLGARLTSSLPCIKIRQHASIINLINLLFIIIEV